MEFVLHINGEHDYRYRTPLYAQAIAVLKRAHFWVLGRNDFEVMKFDPAAMKVLTHNLTTKKEARRMPAGSTAVLPSPSKGSIRAKFASRWGFRSKFANRGRRESRGAEALSAEEVVLWRADRAVDGEASASGESSCLEVVSPFKKSLIERQASRNGLDWGPGLDRSKTHADI